MGNWQSEEFLTDIEEESSEEESSSEEEHMVLQALISIQDKAIDLIELIQEGEEVPEWAEYKIARMSGSIGDIHDYMLYGKVSKVASSSPSEKRFLSQIFGGMRNLFKDNGTLEGANKIVFFNSHDDFFEIEAYPVSRGFKVIVKINAHNFFDKVVDPDKASSTLSEIKRVIGKHV